MDAREVAGSLTKAQRRAVLWADPTGAFKAVEKGGPSVTSFWALGKVTKGNPRQKVAFTYSLVDQGKGELRRGQIWPDRTWALTPLGLAVRAILASEEAEG